jgi:hypothetical protein
MISLSPSDVSRKTGGRVYPITSRTFLTRGEREISSASSIGRCRKAYRLAIHILTSSEKCRPPARSQDDDHPITQVKAYDSKKEGAYLSYRRQTSQRFFDTSTRQTPHLAYSSPYPYISQAPSHSIVSSSTFPGLLSAADESGSKGKTYEPCLALAIRSTETGNLRSGIHRS